MLVLCRREGERVVVNDRLTIVVQKICENRVYIAFDGHPEEFKIWRGEIFDDMTREKSKQ